MALVQADELKIPHLHKALNVGCNFRETSMNKIIHTFSTLLSLTYISCTNKPTKNEANLKDSLFKEYKQQVSKLHELNIDASGIFFLEAFEKSDLNEMQNILMQIKTEISLLKKWPFYDSCLNLTNIKNSTADETY